MNYPEYFRIHALELFSDRKLNRVSFDAIQSELLKQVTFDIGPELTHFLSHNFDKADLSNAELEKLFKEIGISSLDEVAARNIQARKLALEIINDPESAADTAHQSFFSYTSANPNTPRDALDSLRYVCIAWEDGVEAEQYQDALAKANKAALEKAKSIVGEIKIEAYITSHE